MNLGELVSFCGNLLDYDPTNPTYRDQLVSLLNDAQIRCLTDRPWDFSMRDRTLQVYTDVSHEMSFVNGSATVAGVGFPSNPSVITPGSRWDRGEVTVTDSNGAKFTYIIAWVSSANQLFISRDFEGATGTYTVTIRFRNVYLPSDCMTVQNVSDPHVGIPAKALFLSKWEREDANLNPDLLGTIEAYLPSEGKRTPAPQVPRGVSIVAGVGQGIRTINVYMVNVHGPNATNIPVYRPEVSDGWESAFSKVATFNLTDTQTLTFTPETVPSATGFYRRYYFTCPEANILAPVRVRSAGGQGFAALSVDTVSPPGSVTLAPNLALSHLEGQNFQATSIRYRHDNSAAYQSIQLYPHPSADQGLNVRMVVTPQRMLEDQDSPLIPSSYAQLIAYATLENLTLKVDNPALSAVYARKKDTLCKGMEQRFLQAVPRRIVKGLPTAGYRFMSNPYGKLTFTP